MLRALTLLLDAKEKGKEPKGGPLEDCSTNFKGLQAVAHAASLRKFVSENPGKAAHNLEVLMAKVRIKRGIRYTLQLRFI